MPVPTADAGWSGDASAPAFSLWYDDPPRSPVLRTGPAFAKHRQKCARLPLASQPAGSIGTMKVMKTLKTLGDWPFARVLLCARALSPTSLFTAS